MAFGTCQCTFIGFWYDPSSTVAITLELLGICLITITGVTVNYRFRKKLKKEKKNRALGRKGNVIEPLMSLQCIILMFGTPYCQLLHWQFANEIISFHLIPEWLCALLTTLERCISFCVVYNSVFVAAIRYCYIVHQQKSNSWDFDKVGRRFQLASILIPLGMEIVYSCTLTTNIYLTSNAIQMGEEKIESCNDSFANITLGSTPPDYPALSQFTQTLISEEMLLISHYAYVAVTAVVSLNLIEGYLYIKIFGCIKR